MTRSLAGTWVGQMARTGEHIVILENGDAMRSRTLKRVPIEERWDAAIRRFGLVPGAFLMGGSGAEA